MGLNWIAAVKLIPWKDVAAVTPDILKGAKNLWSRARKSGAKPSESDLVDTGAGAEGVAANVNRLTARVAELEAEQRSASDLINALAEQNAQLVAAVGLLRIRTRILLALFALSAVATIALWWR